MSKKIYLANWFEKNKNKIVMPNIQRNFVWREKQVEKLFDSINKGYFIGMFWIWKPSKASELEKVGYWQLLKYYNSKETIKATDLNIQDKIGVLDGQQRLSAISIGLYGSYNERKLYFNTECKRNENPFKFLDEHQAGKGFFKVGDILIGNKQLDPKFREFKNKFQKALFISHEVNGDIGEITDIFERVNKGGTSLSNSQVLLSRLTAKPEWGKDGRKKLENLRRKIEKEFEISIDYEFIMKTSLFLSGETIKFKANQGITDKIDKSLDVIYKNWNRIEKAILRMAGKINQLGFSDKNITSDSALIPLVYIFYKNKKRSDDEIKEYLFRSFLKRIYGKSTDTTLLKVRNIIDKNKSNSLGSILKNDLFVLSAHDISEILDFKKSKYSKLALMILYDDYNYSEKDFDQDHMHPHSIFENKDGLIEKLQKERITKIRAEQCFIEWRTKKDRLPNLEMLHARKNKEKNKSSLEAYWNKHKKALNREDHFLKQNTSLLLRDFDNFYKTRERKMREKLKKYFKVR
ncbi:MAG: DUF262 domain-containing protein [Endomicrobia bacterium]|nr:DUF262 domain-containing protein [Endomicrobiia bacterium]MCL2506336.1 DUF262 domain-containing protein [Endomicrobiia bacterium]